MPNPSRGRFYPQVPTIHREAPQWGAQQVGSLNEVQAPSSLQHRFAARLQSGTGSQMNPNFSLRTAVPRDASFVFSTIESTMRDHVIATWGPWNEARVRQEVDSLCASNAVEIIEVGKDPAGLIVVERFPTHIQLEQLLILPAYQKQKMGSTLIRGLVQEALTGSLPIRLRVLAVNPAKLFYERLGFSVTRTSPEHFFMECAPA